MPVLRLRAASVAIVIERSRGLGRMLDGLVPVGAICRLLTTYLSASLCGAVLSRSSNRGRVWGRSGRR